MIELHLSVIVPESREVTITLPPETPVGSVILTVRVDSCSPPPIEINVDPTLLPRHERSGLVRELAAGT
jgi:hypothetical protein